MPNKIYFMTVALWGAFTIEEAYLHNFEATIAGIALVWAYLTIATSRNKL